MKLFYERYWDRDAELEDFNYKWPVLKEYIPVNKKIKTLDFGCGKGRILHEMIKINPLGIFTGVDVSQNAIDFCKRKYRKNAFYKTEDGAKLPFKPNTFDFITALDVLEHVYDTKNAFFELARVLKPGEKILISVPYHGVIKNLIISLFFWEFIFNPYTPHIRAYTKKSLVRCLRDVNLSCQKIGYYGRIYPFSSGMFILASKDQIC